MAKVDYKKAKEVTEQANMKEQPKRGRPIKAKQRADITARNTRFPTLPLIPHNILICQRLLPRNININTQSVFWEVCSKNRMYLQPHNILSSYCKVFVASQ